MPFHIYQFPFFKSNFLELPKTLTRSSNCKNIAIHQIIYFSVKTKQYIVYILVIRLSDDK